MTAVALTAIGMKNVKHALTASFPYAKSSHLTEAFAAACGFRTHAALLSHAAGTADPDIVLLNDAAFAKRLEELEGKAKGLADEWLDIFETVSYSDREDVFKTFSSAYYKPRSTAIRYRAWRNIMVAAINEAIERRVFTVRPGDNRWIGAKAPDKRGNTPSFRFRFEVAGIPAIAHVSDAGWDELGIHAALWPTDAADHWIESFNSDFLVGEAFATGWLERRDGAWLQTPADVQLRCRAHRLQAVSSLEIAPKGYADRGDSRM